MIVVVTVMWSRCSHTDSPGVLQFCALGQSHEIAIDNMYLQNLD